jgi:hypothetical protein
MADEPAVVSIIDKQLTLLGGYATDNWARPDLTHNLTVIDGQHARRGVSVQQSDYGAPAAGLTLVGFTVQNGLGQAAAGDSEGRGLGGGLLAEHATLTLRDVIFRANRAVGRSGAAAAGGVGVGGGAAIRVDSDLAPNARISLERVTFESNQALGGAGSVCGGEAHGGGFYVYGAEVAGRDLVFRNNAALAHDSAGVGRTSDGRMADGMGGAAAVELNSNVRWTGVVATDNRAVGGAAPGGDGGSAYGGAFFVGGATLELRSADVRNNSATGGNGVNNAPSAATTQGGGLASRGCAPNTHVRLDQVNFIANTARSGDGGIYAGAVGGGGVALTYSHGAHQITNSVFAGNLADVGTGRWVGGGGGGLWLQGVTAELIHTTFAGNRLDSGVIKAGGQGAGIILVTPYPNTFNTAAAISYSIIADHLTSGGSRAALQVMPGAAATLNRGLWANNTKDHNGEDGPGWVGTINGLESWLSAPTAGFMAPAAPHYNHHLRCDSAAKDQAIGSTTPLDMDGSARPFDATADLGADEHGPFRLTVLPGDRSLSLDWAATSQAFQGGAARYEVVVTCPPDGQPPEQGACGAAIDAGERTSLALTGLTNLKPYGVLVTPCDTTGIGMASLSVAAIMPTDRLLYLPLTLRAQP